MNETARDGPRLSIVHRLLLHLPAETAHGLALTGLRMGQSQAPRWLRARFQVRNPKLTQNLLDKTFPNPVGLAAGFDKDGQVISGMEALGFGFVEVGTVTPQGQRGNPKPRLFRHPESASLENAMGFNNRGGQALVARLRRAESVKIPIGVNIGKAKHTPNRDAERDYAWLAAAVGTHCDYLVVNVSSPNTPGLRELQTSGSVGRILAVCREETDRPVLVKLSPDLGDDAALELANTAVESGAAGVILANTTTDYALLPSARRVGGLSGRVLRRRSRELLRLVAGELFGKCLLISVGGIDSGREAYRRLKAGAGLVQLYSALVFRGPSLVPEILRELVALAERDGYAHLSEAVGADL